MTADPTARATVARALDEARAQRDAGIAQAEAADLLGWDRSLIDQAIRVWADTGDPFSANELRDLLPDVRQSLIGARFMAASIRGQIVRVGQLNSTKASTHLKRIGLWIGAQATGDQLALPGTAVAPNVIADVVLRILDQQLGPVTTPRGHQRRRRIARNVAAGVEQGGHP